MRRDKVTLAKGRQVLVRRIECQTCDFSDWSPLQWTGRSFAKRMDRVVRDADALLARLARL